MLLDDDVARLIDREVRRNGTSFKETVNSLLRLGLAASRQASPEAFVVRPRRLGLPAGLSYDNVEQLLEAIEGPTHP